MARKDLLVDSAYPMPWIVYKREYSISVGAYSEVWNQNLAHGLPFIPLIFGQWSDNANFNPSYDLGVDIPGGSTGGQPATMVSVRASATNITFSIINNMAARTFYFRLMAFATPGYTGQVNPVEYNSSFRFNSHYNYQKLFMAGYSTGGPVTHGLGYLPQAKIWAYSSVTQSVNPGHGILTNTSLSSAYDNTPFYYHIYLGEF